MGVSWPSLLLWVHRGGGAKDALERISVGVRRNIQSFIQKRDRPVSNLRGQGSGVKARSGTLRWMEGFLGDTLSFLFIPLADLEAGYMEMDRPTGRVPPPWVLWRGNGIICQQSSFLSSHSTSESGISKERGIQLTGFGMNQRDPGYTDRSIPLSPSEKGTIRPFLYLSISRSGHQSFESRFHRTEAAFYLQSVFQFPREAVN